MSAEVSIHDLKDDNEMMLLFRHSGFQQRVFFRTVEEASAFAATLEKQDILYLLYRLERVVR